MVPARNLMAEQLHEPLSNFFKKPRFELDRESLTTKSTMALANKADEEIKDAEEKVDIGRNPNPKDWLQLGVASTHEIRKAEPIELELFTDSLSGQTEKQMISSFKRQRNALLEAHLRSSCDPVIGCDFTVVSTPRRPEAGMWLVLSAAQNQLKDPLLPQTERNYLRIKDCNMTVRLLMKYLASKLGLKNESESNSWPHGAYADEEVEICCKGQSLPPFLMLQYVRDHIWSSKEATELPTRVGVTDHVMTLTYRRRRLSE